jgi:hypothetical protein
MILGIFLLVLKHFGKHVTKCYGFKSAVQQEIFPIIKIVLQSKESCVMPPTIEDVMLSLHNN